MAQDKGEGLSLQLDYNSEIHQIDKRGEVAGKGFFEQFIVLRKLSRNQASRILYQDPSPIISALTTSLQSVTRDQISRVVRAKNLPAEAVDWEVTTSWIQKMLSPIGELIEKEKLYLATDPKRRLGRDRVNKTYEAELEKHMENVYCSIGYTSLTSQQKSKNWVISDPTRIALLAYARYVNAFAETATIPANLGGHGFYPIVRDYLCSWSYAFTLLQPPKTPEEIMVNKDRVRFGVPNEILPDYNHRPDINTRSQTIGRGLPGRFSRQPDRQK
ncbi:MAG: hypothetical protein WC596_03980 [Candidatus Shapirobacteria bacterium]